MQLQTFVGPTVAEAMNQVRRGVGDDAIIVATREHPHGGIAVTVVVEREEDSAPMPAGPAIAAPPEPAAPAVLAEPAPPIEPATPAEQSVPVAQSVSVPQAISIAQAAPAAQTAPLAAAAPFPPPRRRLVQPAPSPTGPGRDNDNASVADALYAAFRAHGLPAAIGGALMDMAVEFETSDPQTALAAALEQCFTFDPVDVARPAGPIMAVGPSGAGKTQTIGKLAARAAMAGRTVTLITTDTERTGRSAPLAGFASTLGCVLAEAANAKALNQALAAAVASDVVLIDCPGASHLDQSEMDHVQDCLIDGLVEPLLVVPAGIDPIEAADIADAYYAIGARRAVVTRLDAVRRLGGSLAIAHENLLGLAQFGTGQRIKDTLIDAAPFALARALLPGQPDITMPTTGPAAALPRDERAPA